MKFIKKIESLSEEDLLTIFEAARVALSDAEVYEYIADKLDLSDEYLKDLQEKLTTIME